MLEFKIKKPMSEDRVTKETPDNRRTYGNLLGLFGFAMFADGIKAFCINELRLTGLWGLSGYDRWSDFCVSVLHVSKSTADRMVADGAVARKLVGKQQNLNKLLESDVFRQIDEKSTDVVRENVPSPSVRAVVSDRKLQRAIRNAPSERWVEVVEKAGAGGKITPKTIAATIRTVVGPSVEKVKAKPVPAFDDRYDKLRDVLRHIGESLIEMSDMTAPEFAASIGELNGYVQQLRLAAGKLKR